MKTVSAILSLLAAFAQARPASDPAKVKHTVSETRMLPTQPTTALPGFQPAPVLPDYEPASGLSSFQPAPVLPDYEPTPGLPSFQPAPVLPDYEPTSGLPGFQPSPVVPDYPPTSALPNQQPDGSPIIGDCFEGVVPTSVGSGILGITIRKGQCTSNVHLSLGPQGTSGKAEHKGTIKEIHL